MNSPPLEAGCGCGAALVTANNALGGTPFPKPWAQRRCCDAVLLVPVPPMLDLVFSGEFFRASDLIPFTGKGGDNGSCSTDFSGLNKNIMKTANRLFTCFVIAIV